jgi:hypothetical protein
VGAVTGPVPPIQRHGDAVLLSGPAVLLARRLVALGVEQAALRGGGIGNGARQLLNELEAATNHAPASEVGRPAVAAEPANRERSFPTDEITTGEAATLMQLSTRQVTRLAREGKIPARQRNGVWLFDRRTIQDHRRTT